MVHRVISVSAGPFLVERDADLYWVLSSRMSGGDWLLSNPPVSYPLPLYPAYLAACRLAFGADALLGAIIGQHTMGILTSVLIAAACRIATRSSLAWALGYLLSALALGRVQLANASLTETLATLMVAGHCLALAAWHRAPSPRMSGALGATLAAVGLVRPTAGLFWPVEVIVVAFRRNAGPSASSTRASSALCFLLAYFAVGGTNIARELALFGSTAPSSAQGILWLSTFREGARLPLPRSPLADVIGDPDGEWRNEFVAAERLKAKGLDPIETQKAMRDLALAAIRKAPISYLRGYLANWLGSWTSIEEAIPWYPRAENTTETGTLALRTWSEPRIFRPFEPILRLAYRYSRTVSGIAAAVALSGAALLLFHRGSLPLGVLLLSLMTYWASIVALAWPLFRYRAPLHPAMILSTVVAGHVLLSIARQKGAVPGRQGGVERDRTS